MIETTSFVFLFHRFSGFAVSRAVHGGEYVRINQLGAILAITTLRIVPEMDFNGPLTGGATDVPHGFPLVRPYNARVAQMIMECAFLVVECGDDEANRSRHSA